LRDPAWLPFRVEAHPSRCGHSKVTVYLPDGTGWWQEILVVEGEVRGDTSASPQATPSTPVQHTGPV